MKIRLARAHFPVTVLGPGRRLGLWLQGCSIGCPGCLARDTWDVGDGDEIEIDLLLEWCRATTRGGFDGVTISGGEPFDQPVALLELVQSIAGWRADLRGDFDILCYSGYAFPRLESRHAEILRHLDILIPEPFRLGLDPVRWRGSSNQPVLALSARGEASLRHALGAGEAPENRLQVGAAGARIHVVGIPGRGDLDRLRVEAEGKGVTFGGASWKE